MRLRGMGSCALPSAARAVGSCHWYQYGTSLWVDVGHGATGNLYDGLHEWPDMAFVLASLRPPAGPSLTSEANRGSDTAGLSCGGCLALWAAMMPTPTRSPWAAAANSGP